MIAALRGPAAAPANGASSLTENTMNTDDAFSGLPAAGADAMAVALGLTLLLYGLPTAAQLGSAPR